MATNYVAKGKLMNTIIPQYHIAKSKRGKQRSSFNNQPPVKPSFKANPVSIVSELDKPIIDTFKKFYGPVSDRVVGKIDKIYHEYAKKGLRPRFNIQKGITSVREKTFGEAIAENALFPVTKIPKWTASWVVKQAGRIKGLEEPAKEIYRSDFLRKSRKLHELDEKTDILKGIYEKTSILLDDFAKKNGVQKDDITKLLTDSKKKLTPKELKLKAEAEKYIGESLYKVSNKFFDKHTGNFNTAYERPLNRIVSGLIPVAFLANDAYNLSVLCGDSKEVSKKEAKERQKQEVSRVFTTAYIQLLTFGAFTKFVNTKAWFAPMISALTVLFSETSSRLRLGKPITFLTKEQAKEYNKKQKAKENAQANGAEKSTFKGKVEDLKKNFVKKEEKVANSVDNKSVQQNTNTNSVQANEQSKVAEKVSQSNLKSTNVLENSLNTTQTSSFKAKEKVKEKDKKPQKALITMDTFKKGLAILTIGGFVLSFLKNSSLTKNSALMKTIRGFADDFKKKFYNPVAFKEFEFSSEKFKKIMGTMEDLGFKEVADGHRLLKEKFAEETKEGTFKLFRTKLPKENVSNVIDAVVEKLSKSSDISADTVEKIRKVLPDAIEKSATSIEENSFRDVAYRTIEKVVNDTKSLAKEEYVHKYARVFTDEQREFLKDIIDDVLSKNVTKEAIQVETKVKPFIDVLMEPFKFMGFIGGMPFRILSSAIKAGCNAIINKDSSKYISKEELEKIKKPLKKFMVEMFGEKSTKSAKTTQKVFLNALEGLEKNTHKYYKTVEKYANAAKENQPTDVLLRLEREKEKAKELLRKRVGTAIEKSFNGVTQSSTKNTDLAMLSKLSSSLVTSAFLVADNYNMVMIKSDGEDKEDAKEKANERIIQRLSALFYQTMFINLFNSTFRAQYNSSLKGMASVVAPNTITTEVVTRSSIGMPIRRKTYDEIAALEEKNANRKGLAGKYFKFMRLLTGKKPLKDRMPKNKTNESAPKTIENKAKQVVINSSSIVNKETNLLNKHLVVKQ